MTAKPEVQETEAPTPTQPETAGARLAARKAAKAARKAAERGKSDVITDTVQQQAIEASSWVTDHGRTIGLAIAIAAVAGAGLIAYRYFAGQQASTAAAALGTAVKASLGAVGTAEEIGETLPDEQTFETADARSTKALADYREVVAKHGGTEAALWARLGEGSELLSLGKAEEAGREFAAVASATDSTFLKYRALEGRGFALEAQDKLDDATQQFVDIGKLDNGAYKPASDYHLARLLAVRGDAKGAKEMLSKLIDSLGEQALTKGPRFAAIKDAAELRLAELGGTRKAQPGAGLSGVGAEGLTPELLETLRRQLEKAPAPEGQ